ncbi:hypothetical protein [Halopseudomonas salina]|uniref:7-cyano-7-deazaguanine synthase n=1 Tax=Halopseudomonas salina TaxID=1323744 RepID=A0ABQ1PQI2_9GAMM|nr:hypothetical protein [Halopseudomonas salina]GGD00822.1 hypothetical protein GCM10007418_20080 [Halopseudomonas salina]
MTEIVLRQVSWEPVTENSTARIEFSIVTPVRDYQVYISGRGLQPQPGLEAGVALAVLAGMRKGWDLRVDGELSESFLAGVYEYMRRFTESFTDFQPVNIKPLGTYKATIASKGAGCASFFSGGADSFFTLIKGKEQITDIVYIHGFDVRLDDFPRRAAVDATCLSVAEALGVNYLPVESNLGKVLQDFGSWPLHAHGLALIAVARMLAGNIGEVRIPGSFSVDEQKPWGSWLYTDHLFSDERLQIVHDACEARRMDKIKHLAGEPLALQNLRVCWERVDGMYNCCRCEKCMRTMTSLEILGVLDKAPVFPLPLDPARVAAVCLPRAGMRIFPQENLRLLRNSGRNLSALEHAICAQIERPIWVARFRLRWKKRMLRCQHHLAKLKVKF